MEHDDLDDVGDEHQARDKYFDNLRQEQYIRYNNAKNRKVGDTVTCPVCKKSFIKRTYQQTFCGTRGKNKHLGKGRLCKDQYHNLQRAF